MPHAGSHKSTRGSATEQACALCERVVPAALITLHHLLPKERGGKAEHRLPFCRPCHKQVHAMFSNRQLADHYITIDQLRTAPELATFLPWIRKQRADRYFRTTTSATHPKRRRKR
jgi:5-methylcytosine-specific restriction enzyme A